MTGLATVRRATAPTMVAPVRPRAMSTLVSAALPAFFAALAPLAQAADNAAPAIPGQLAAGSAGGWLLMGIFLQLLITIPPILLLHRKWANGRLNAAISVLACAVMAALYWFAGGGTPRSWLAAGWAVIAILLLLTWATWKGQPVRKQAPHPPPQPKSKRHKKPRSQVQQAYRQSRSGVRPSWAHRGGLGMVGGFLAIVFVGTSEVDVVLLIISAVIWAVFALVLCNSMVYALMPRPTVCGSGGSSDSYSSDSGWGSDSSGGDSGSSDSGGGGDSGCGGSSE